jgi:hypothetical protein
MALRDWLQLFRAHTAPATVLAFVTPYLIAGGRDITVAIILFVVGHFIHYFSFGHNSLMDYWVDKEDPSKAHHPLPSGRISLEDATRVVLYGQIITYIIVMLLCIQYSANPVLSLFFLGIYFVFGNGYNDGLDHRTVHSWFPISACYAGFVLITYTFVRGLDTIAALIALWAFISEVYDIALLGNVKDLWNPAETLNPLRKYVITKYTIYENGTEHVISITLSRGVLTFFWFLRGVVASFILFTMAELLGLPLVNYVLLVLLTALELFAITAIFKGLATGSSTRGDLLALFGLSEATEFFRFTCLVPAWMAGLLIVYGLTYFISFNKLLWGTRLAPRV